MQQVQQQGYISRQNDSYLGAAAEPVAQINWEGGVVIVCWDSEMYGIS